MTYQEWARKQYEEGHGLSWQPSAKDAWEAATIAERERCAKLCEEMIQRADDWDSSYWDQACDRIAMKIRAS